VGLLELDLYPETEPEVAALSLPSFAVPIPFLRSWSIGVLEKIKWCLGGLCFFVTERCNFSFRFGRVGFRRRLERKLARSSCHPSSQGVQLFGQLSIGRCALLCQRPSRLVQSASPEERPR
jgi:hypothetical protein